MRNKKVLVGYVVYSWTILCEVRNKEHDTISLKYHYGHIISCTNCLLFDNVWYKGFACLSVIHQWFLEILNSMTFPLDVLF